MDKFTPLTQEQFQQARLAGFSVDQIIQNEQRRKSEFELSDKQTKATPWSQSLGTTISWKVSPEELQNPELSPIKSIARPIVNLALSPLQVAENVAKIPFNVYDLAKTEGVSGLAGAGTEVLKNLTSPLVWLGKNIEGGISTLGRRITGKSLDPESETAFAKTMEQIKNPLETAYDVSKAIYQTSQENPLAIPLALEGGAQTIAKLRGGAYGTGISGLTGKKGPDVISSMAKPVVVPIRETIKLATKPFIPAATEARIGQFEKLFNPSKGLAATEAKYEKNSPAFAAQLEKEGVKFEFGRDERGRLDTTKAQNNVSEIATRDNEMLNRLLQSSGETLSLDQAGKNAINEAIRIYKGTAQDSAIQHITDEIMAYKRQYVNRGAIDVNGELKLPAEIINEIKQDLWSKSKFPPFGSVTEQINAGTKFLMGHAIKDTIQKVIGQNNLVGRLNQRLGDIASLQKMLQKAQGGAIHGWFMGRLAARVIGGTAGGATGGGALGVVTGSITGDLIMDALTNPNRPISWVTAVLKRAKNETPELLREVESRIQKNIQERTNRKRLPEPSYIPMGAGTPPPVTMELVPAKRISIKNPKTGRHERSYTSEVGRNPKIPKTTLGTSLKSKRKTYGGHTPK